MGDGVVAHILGQHEGRREAEEIAHDHEGAVEVAARQPGQARAADQQGDAEGNPDLQAPGAGVALNDACVCSMMCSLWLCG
jgi:hypothetical protein